MRIAACLAVAAALIAAPSGAAARTLYVTNADSSTISTFKIDASGGLSTPSRTNTLERPLGIVLSPDGDTAYVVNNFAHRVSVFKVGVDGTLTPFGEPVKTGGEQPFGIALAPDGRTLYVANLDPRSEGEPSTIGVLAVRDDGSLAPRPPLELAEDETPRTVAVSPDGRFLFVEEGLFDEVTEPPDTVISFAIRGDGTFERRGRVTIGATCTALAIPPDGRSLYVPCENLPAGPPVVHGFGIRADGSLAPLRESPYPAADFPFGAAVTPDGRHLYTTDGGAPGLGVGSRAVSGFAIGADGVLDPIDADPATPRADPFEAGQNPIGIGPTPDGRHLFVANAVSSDVSRFAIGSAGGLAKLGETPTGGTAPRLQSVTVRPNQGPRASFSATVAGRTVRFDGSASSDSDGRVARYDWDFGDGSTQADGGPTPPHVYGRSGTFRVTLTVTDDEGCSAKRVFTGQSVLCNGSSAARVTRTVVVYQESRKSS